MKNTLLLLISFLYFSISFSQDKFKINYSGNLDTSLLENKIADGKYDTISKEKKDLILSLIKKDKQTTFSLEINKNESLFYQNKSMEIGKKLNISSIIGGKGTIYHNIESKQILEQKEAFGELFLIESNSDSITWNFTKESKQIDKYLCYKASTEKIIKNSKGIHKVDVIAWYCPEIAISFGPSGYNSLPGLIIELVVDKYKYSVSKIDLDAKEIDIKIPEKGEKVTKREFENIALEMTKRFN